jgi:hypothetical protein
MLEHMKSNLVWDKRSFLYPVSGLINKKLWAIFYFVVKILLFFIATLSACWGVYTKN